MITIYQSGHLDLDEGRQVIWDTEGFFKTQYDALQVNADLFVMGAKTAPAARARKIRVFESTFEYRSMEKENLLLKAKQDLIAKGWSKDQLESLGL